MRPPDELSFVFDACQEMRRVLALVADSTSETYAADRKLQAAVERGVHIVGEALSRTTDGFRQRHPQVPWRKLIAARHLLAHEYGAHLVEPVWRIARNDYPRWQPLLEDLLPSELRRMLESE